MKTPDPLHDYMMSDPTLAAILYREEWLEVERNAREAKLLTLQLRLRTGPFKEKR